MPLSAPLKLFSWDWANEPPETLCRTRVADLQLPITRDGTLTALFLYFHLDCDDDDEQTCSTGPDDVPNPPGGPLTHWDQSVRYLPVGLHVRSGSKLRLMARHTDSSVQLGLRDVLPSMLADVGHADAVVSGRGCSIGAGTTGTALRMADVSTVALASPGAACDRPWAGLPWASGPDDRHR